MSAVVDHLRPAMSVDGEAMLSVSAAARLVGCSRSTVLRRIEAGELTRTPGGKLHQPDVLRVLGDLIGHGDGGDADMSADTCSGSADRVSADRAEVVGNGANSVRTPAVPLSVVTAMQSQLSDLIEQLAEQREAMQRAEEAHTAERTAMIARLDRLLPAPEPESVPEPPRGFFRRLFS